MLAFALMGQNFLSLSVFLFSMNWSSPWPHGARENPGMLSPVQGFKQQEGAFLMTLDNIHSFPGFCNPLFIFPLMAPVLTFYPGLLVILSQAPLFLLVAESPTGSTSHHRMWCAQGAGLGGQIVAQLPCKEAPSDRSYSWPGHWFSWWQLALTHLSWVTLPDTVIPTWQH